MLSVCIPVYNYDVRTLIKTIAEQISKLQVPAEIICIDDCSTEECQKQNYEVCNKYGRYIILNENIGRTRIRNKLASLANFPWLLFLDCDLGIPSKFFIRSYIEIIEKFRYPVVCGGLMYQKDPPSRNQRLRWRYGIKKESIPLSKRLKNPNKSFMTSNFLVNKQVFQSILFDERLSVYGHEDTLFGYNLMKENILVFHIDNPVVHLAIDDNVTFLNKTRHSIDNLLHILQFENFDRDFIEDVTILKTYYSLKKYFLHQIVTSLYFIFSPLLLLYFRHQGRSLTLFAFFKLGYLSKKMKLILNKT